jgi:hypothetical protein
MGCPSVWPDGEAVKGDRPWAGTAEAAHSTAEAAVHRAATEARRGEVIRRQARPMGLTCRSYRLRLRLHRHQVEGDVAAMRLSGVTGSPACGMRLATISFSS